MKQIIALVAAVAVASSAGAQVTSTIFFDNQGAEAGITLPGASTFSLFGSNWSGGAVVTESNPPLYASGFFSYSASPNGAMVTFDSAIDSVNFFFVHGTGQTPGVATAFDSGGSVIAAVSSSLATFFNDPANFVTVNPASSIASIQFSGAFIDSFSFTTVPAPASATMFALAGLTALRRRRG